ncbi:hypothetical protein TCAL_07058 [Tigriopus californicus]|uniref:Uncharacterized protein n=1 Tax=Tigriopus californicus TaxID=6832 RepID=A0A553PP11_TIGCA|nr:uncharacterized protein LOC131882622 isoform X2 [Tigriopus californicus]TRY79412.1 hypothetical protein TCAL_07058 [Tigriopus californicus]|eukprot:TCALIF_07058-PA protein Name:"Protein of unknown function" AED:0.41 eAED:0.43 QI:0/-1/0/1/-1/1/1/0/208
MGSTEGNEDWWHKLSEHCSRVQIQDWTILLPNQFDLHWNEEPHLTRMILFNPVSGHFITRVLGRTLESGTLDSLDALVPLASSFFLSQVCLGRKENEEDMFPFSLSFSLQCSMILSGKPESNGDLDQESKHWNHPQCEECRRLSIEEDGSVFDDLGMDLDGGGEMYCKQESFKEDIEDYDDDIPELFVGNVVEEVQTEDAPKKKRNTK